jgi:hypothetical protein
MSDMEPDKDEIITALRHEIDRLQAILMNVALALGADDSAEFRKHIGWHS